MLARTGELVPKQRERARARTYRAVGAARWFQRRETADLTPTERGSPSARRPKSA
ncbi:MAG: hypothetical protein MZV64_22810 [Ignavibacteriales bacterium]|nr:hypothetical protein [Ignavibacteriales bacterium]